MKKGFERLVSLLLAVLLTAGLVTVPAKAAPVEQGHTQLIQLVPQPDYSHYYTMTETHNGVEMTFPVYCMNNSLHWPEPGDSYTPGYLDATLNAEAIEKLRRVLYAGYPNNGAGLFELINYGDPVPGITLEAFNARLKLNSELLQLIQNDPDLSALHMENMEFTLKGDGTGTLDYVTTPEFLAIDALMAKDFEWSFSSDPDEVAKSDVLRSSNCYAAMISVFTAAFFEYNVANVLEIYNESYAADYYVTLGAAYGATQDAVWVIMQRYGVEDNNNAIIGSALTSKIVAFADGMTPIPSKEVAENEIDGTIHLTNADGTAFTKAIFTRNHVDGKYYSQPLIIHSQTDATSNPIYAIEYDVRFNTSSHQKVQGDAPFRLVSDVQPTDGELEVTADLIWPSKVFQYGTTSIDAVDGKGYQHMAGLYLKEKALSVTSLHETTPTTSLKITKQTNSPLNETGVEFWFKVQLDFDETGWFNAKHTLKDGTVHDAKLYHYADHHMTFVLKADESMEILDLPIGSSYKIEEIGLQENVPGLGNWNNITGTILGVLDASSANNVKTVQNNWQYSVASSVAIVGEKHLEQGGLPITVNHAFEFIMWPDNPTNPMPTGSVFNTTTSREEKIVNNTTGSTVGTFDFGTISFTAAGTYEYTIEERQIPSGITDISRDPTHYHVTINVTEAAGSLNVSTPVYEQHHVDHTPITTASNAKFVNTKEAHAVYKELRVEKKIQNHSSDVVIPLDGYQFNIQPATTGIDYPTFGATSSTSTTITTGVSGEAVSETLRFSSDMMTSHGLSPTNPITFEYNIHEVVGTKPGVSYSQDAGRAWITVSINSSNEVSADITYQLEDQAITTTPIVFTNNYSASDATSLVVEKYFTNAVYNPQIGETYTFTIDDDFARNEEKAGHYQLASNTITLTYDGTTFVSTGGQISFDLAGDYRFAIKEVSHPENTKMSYDDNEWIVDVLVMDNGVGGFTFNKIYTNENTGTTDSVAKFYNTYHPEVEVTMDFKKIITGRNWNDNDHFTIRMVHGESASPTFDPTNLTNICLTHDNVTHAPAITLGSLATTQSKITLKAPGTYYFRMQEELPIAPTTMIYDDTIYIAKVVVSAVGQELVATETYYRGDRQATWPAGYEEITKDTLTFTNKVTSFTIEKMVTDTTDTHAFDFELVLKDEAGNIYNGTYPATYNDGTEIILDFMYGKAPFQLTHGQSITLTGVPNNAKFEVKEIAPAYQKEIKINGETVTTATGTINVNQAVNVTFKNTLKATGDLKVSKVVTGNNADLDKAFPFKVTLDDETINGTFGELTFTNGVATLNLKHGESKQATGLYVGVGYKVEETEHDGYNVSYTNEQGTITANQVIDVVATNQKTGLLNPINPILGPNTGDHAPIALISAVAAMAMATYIGLKKKKED